MLKVFILLTQHVAHTHTDVRVPTVVPTPVGVHGGDVIKCNGHYPFA